MSAEPTKKRPRTVPAPTSMERGTTVLPTSRVNRIIKADQDVNLCSKEAIFLIAKAAERMIAEVTNQAHANARLQKRNKLVKYSDLATTASQSQWFYLGEVIPHPIPLKVAQAKRQQADDSLNAPSSATTATAEKPYEGKRIMKGKKRASLAAQTAETGGAIDVSGSAEKRKTRGKQVDYSGVAGGDEEDEDEEELREGQMDVDD
ncbi:histone-fold domain-containing protein [Sporobolomyces salmoneus]|uniref:histone-fold domain-containing protein n=1 Tax=Sporobolomyces salmoneus TaxID=183962 RepID=UPI00316D640C